MDYWEFAQFLGAIGLPRLREAQATLSSFSKPCRAVTTSLSNIEQLLVKITTSSRKFTFFKCGTLPVELLRLNPTVSDNLATCDCLIRETKQEKEIRCHINIQPFSALYDLLPKEFQQIFVLDKDAGFIDPSRQRTHAQFIFRLFELMTINTVLGEVLQCVSV